MRCYDPVVRLALASTLEQDQGPAGLKRLRIFAEQELKRLEAMPPVSAEATVSRNYIDWLVSVPWTKKSREIKDLERAQRILDEDHYGLDKVKERILEYLAVQQRVRKLKGPILCLVGPPGKERR